MFRHKAQHAGNGCSIDKCCNAGAGHQDSALRVSVAAPMDCVVSIAKGATIRCKTRLAMNADTLTEYGIITLKGHWQPVVVIAGRASRVRKVVSQPADRVSLFPSHQDISLWLLHLKPQEQ